MEDQARPSQEEKPEVPQQDSFLQTIDAAARKGRSVDRVYGVGEADSQAKRKPSRVIGLVLISIGLASLLYLLFYFIDDTLFSRTLARIAVLGLLVGAAGVYELLNWEGQRKRNRV